MTYGAEGDGDADDYRHGQKYLALKEIELLMADLLLLAFPLRALEKNVLAFPRESDLLTGLKPARLFLM
jgi:hypothetical protein